MQIILKCLENEISRPKKSRHSFFRNCWNPSLRENARLIPVVIHLSAFASFQCCFFAYELCLLLVISPGGHWVSVDVEVDPRQQHNEGGRDVSLDDEVDEVSLQVEHHFEVWELTWTEEGHTLNYTQLHTCSFNKLAPGRTNIGKDICPSCTRRLLFSKTVFLGEPVGGYWFFPYRFPSPPLPSPPPPLLTCGEL